MHFLCFDHSIMQDANSLLVRIRAGDNQAIEEVYLSCREGFCQNMAYKWNLSAEQVLELYQVSFMAILSSVQRGNLQQVQKGWLPLLKGVGKNLQLAKIRQAKRMPIDSSKEAPPETIDDNDADQKEQVLQIIEGELNSLDNKCKELIDLRVFKDMSFKDIYSTLNPSSPTQEANDVGGIRVQYGRCMDRLRRNVFERLKKP